jgi:CheY-like chemotaxis protein
VTVAEQTDETVTVRFDVRDTGIGIEPNRIERLFEAFAQADTATTREFGGTGLGLAISLELTHMMGGTMHAESELGKGSTFSLQIPFAYADALLPASPPATEAPAAHGQAPEPDEREFGRPRRRILVAEDQHVNWMLIERMLARRGYSAVNAADGRAAVDMLGSEHYDLVLMDCHMPVLDGYDATREIRRREAAHGGRIPIVAMTANAMLGDRERCLAAGMDDYMSKPISSEAVDATLARWLPPSREDAQLLGHARLSG